LEVPESPCWTVSEAEDAAFLMASIMVLFERRLVCLFVLNHVPCVNMKEVLQDEEIRGSRILSHIEDLSFPFSMHLHPPSTVLVLDRIRLRQKSQ